MLFQVVCFILPHNPYKPHSGDRVGLGTAAEQGIEAYLEGLSSLLSQSPNIINALEISASCIFLSGFSLAPKYALLPLKVSLQWQFFDQGYSCQLPTW